MRERGFRSRRLSRSGRWTSNHQPARITDAEHRGRALHSGRSTAAMRQNPCAEVSLAGGTPQMGTVVWSTTSVGDRGDRFAFYPRRCAMSVVDRAIAVAAGATVVVLAGVAGAISYSHMAEMARLHGENGWRAHAFPISVDGIEIVASLVLLAHRRVGTRAGWLPWAALAAGTAASVAANVAARASDPVGRLAGWPAVALLVSIPWHWSDSLARANSPRRDTRRTNGQSGPARAYHVRRPRELGRRPGCPAWRPRTGWPHHRAPCAAGRLTQNRIIPPGLPSGVARRSWSRARY